jgi:hypothetical protein
MKTCAKCKKDKPLSEFYERKKEGLKKDGTYIRDYMCKSCSNERTKLYRDANKITLTKNRRERERVCYANNTDGYREKKLARAKAYLKTPAGKEKKKATRKIYHEANKEKLARETKAWRESNKEYCIGYAKNYKETHRKEGNERQKKKYHSDPLYKCRTLARSAIRRVLKSKNFHKKHKTNQILKCSFEYFFYYIERQFKEGMTWENHGEWELDHAVPHSLGITAEEVIALNHYSNFQPLWKEDNLKKTNKLILDMISPENKIRYKTIISRHV